MKDSVWKNVEELLQSDDLDFGFYYGEFSGEPDENPPCNHVWDSTILISSVVYDCKKCKMKKEDIDIQK